jgi:predicted permease
MTPGESLVSPNQLYVTPGYLEALRVPLVRGRLFAESDSPPAPRVIVIDEQLAARFWPNADAIGRRVYLPNGPEELAKPTPDTAWIRVVGVVKSVKLKGLVEGEDARLGAYYLPYASNPTRNIGFAIRTSGVDPTTVTKAVNGALTSIDPEMQLFDTFAMTDRIERSLNPRRAPMLLSLGFGVVALLLASIGIYGVLAYQVGQRTREIGIRMALGSDTSRVLRLILREGIALVLLGLAVGLVGTTALRGFIASQLYGVGPLDASVMLLVATVLAFASLLACIGPARRASRVDPVIALQS